MPLYNPAASGGGSISVTDGTTTVNPATSLKATVVADKGSGVAQLLAVVVSAEEPALDEGQLWLRTQQDGLSYQLYVRQPNQLWHQASAGVGTEDYGDGFLDTSQRQVGVYDLANGSLVGMEVIYETRSVRLSANSAEYALSYVLLTPTQMTLLSPAILVYGLPTSDPGVANQLWNDTGVLKISAGA